jgi:hypothetical protein
VDRTVMAANRVKAVRLKSNWKMDFTLTRATKLASVVSLFSR